MAARLGGRLVANMEEVLKQARAKALKVRGGMGCRRGGSGLGGEPGA